MLSLAGVTALNAAGVELAWNPNSDREEISGYRLHYGITSGRYEETLDVGHTESAILEDLGDGIRYFVALTAYNQAGLESEYSEEFEFTTSAAADDISNGGNDGVDASDAEGEDGGTSVSTGTGEFGLEAEGDLPEGKATAELIWDANPEADGVAGYRLYYGVKSGSYPAMLDAGNSTSVTVIGLAEKTPYFVVLTAYNEKGMESAPSEEFQFVSSTNLPPEIILSQVGGSGTVSADGHMILLATARDEDGIVSRVDFYDGTRLLHSDENFPFALRVSGLGAGLHRLRAVAVDNWGETTESTALSVQVEAVLAPEPKTPTLALKSPVTGKTPLFKVTATPGMLVHLEASADLSEWNFLSESRADDSGDVEITDPTPEEELPDQRFYRVVIP